MLSRIEILLVVKDLRASQPIWVAVTNPGVLPRASQLKSLHPLAREVAEPGEGEASSVCILLGWYFTSTCSDIFYTI